MGSTPKVSVLARLADAPSLVPLVPKHWPKGGSVIPSSGEDGKGVHETVGPGVVGNQHAASGDVLALRE